MDVVVWEVGIVTSLKYWGFMQRGLRPNDYSICFLRLMKLLLSNPKVLKNDNMSVASHRTDV